MSAVFMHLISRDRDGVHLWWLWLDKWELTRSYFQASQEWHNPSEKESWTANPHLWVHQLHIWLAGPLQWEGWDHSRSTQGNLSGLQWWCLVGHQSVDHTSVQWSNPDFRSSSPTLSSSLYIWPVFSPHISCSGHTPHLGDEQGEQWKAAHPERYCDPDE